jgi:hypothetical protein
MNWMICERQNLNKMKWSKLIVVVSRLLEFKVDERVVRRRRHDADSKQQ